MTSPTQKRLPVTADRAEPQRIPSERLLGEAGQAVVIHRGREYTLRQTQNGKLILTA